jgi:phenylalanyl-tRNA synthetase beta chain
MHAYDYDEIKGHHLTARVAKAGENLHTLDDSSRVAKGTELVIADDEKPAGLAGVMGGLETEVTEKYFLSPEQTAKILLNCDK